MLKNNDASKKKLFIFISIIVITSLHYMTTTQIHILHDIYQRLYYIPIIFAAVWYGVKGGITISGVISVLYVLHIIVQWKLMPHVSLQKYLEIVMFNLVALLTGFLTEREQKQKKKYLETADKLQDSYDKLKKQAGEMIEVEEQLRHADKLTMLGQISAELAHEIRNPLGSIKGTVEIIKEDYKEDDKKYEFIKILIKETNRLNDVLNNYLHFTKGKTTMSSLVDINSLLEESVNFFTLQLKKKVIAVKLDLGDDIDKIELEGEQLKQVIFNIILNSLQAMPDGGTLTVTTRTERIDDGSGKKTDYLSIDFSDTGIGIREENLANLFKPFYTSKEEGTGLGLSISQKIIEKFGGSIAAKSILNEGTTITVKLPYSNRDLDEEQEDTDNR